ncbi:hypothetical protein Avbf_08788 [Armadillidium vulgare]|nr:hypothetical protein Avbf_08788 [Armadillidium vulgare]
MQHKYVSRYSGTVKDVIEKFEEIRDAEEKDEGNLKSTKFIFTTFIGMYNLSNNKTLLRKKLYAVSTPSFHET